MPRGNQNPQIEEEQTTQWSKEKVQKDKQRSTKHTYKSKDRVAADLPQFLICEKDIHNDNGQVKG